MCIRHCLIIQQRNNLPLADVHTELLMAAVAKRKEKKNKRAEELLESLLIDKSIIEETGRELGVGSYGRVVELKMNRVKCAGKKLYSESLKSVRQSNVILERFADECIRLSSLRHPNIVQFLGLVIEDDSTTMITELLPFSLLKCLSLYPSIPLHLKNTMLLDISLGLVYLHSRGIVHRDLSSSNVLLTCALQAKIADFGIAHVLTSCKDFSTTALEGATDFMPPEATMTNEKDRVVCDFKADIFSLGHVILHTVVQQLFPLPPMIKVTAPNRTVFGVSEIDRRKELFDRMGEKHHLRDLACLCLRDNPTERPSSIQVVDVLEEFCKEMNFDRPNTLELMRRIAELEAPAASDRADRRSGNGLHVLAAEPAVAQIQTLNADPYPKLMPASFPPRDGKTGRDTQGPEALKAVHMSSSPANFGTGSGLRRVSIKGSVDEATSELEHVYVNAVKWMSSKPHSRGQASVVSSSGPIYATVGGLHHRYAKSGIAKAYQTGDETKASATAAFVNASVGQRVKRPPLPPVKGIPKHPLIQDGAEANSFCKPQRRVGADDTPTNNIQKGPVPLHQNASARKPQEAVAPEFRGMHPVPKPRSRNGNRDL